MVDKLTNKLTNRWDVLNKNMKLEKSIYYWKQDRLIIERQDDKTLNIS